MPQEPAGHPARPALLAAFRPREREAGRLRGRRADVLVDPEDVLRVVLGLDPRESVVVVAVRRLHALLARVAFAHEVHVAAARRVRVDRVPVPDAPVTHLAGARRVAVGAEDDRGPLPVAAGVAGGAEAAGAPLPGGGGDRGVAFGDVVPRAVDAVLVHRGGPRGDLPPPRGVLRRELVGPLLKEAPPPVGLDALRVEAVE